MKRLFALLAAVLVGGAATAAPVVVPVGTPIGGQTQAQWSANWWNWAFSFPDAISPVEDLTGAQAFRGDLGGVFLLAGSYSQDPVNRTATVRADQTLFFPIVNTVSWESVSLYGTDEAGLRRDVAEYLGEGSNMFLTWDGVDLLSPADILANQRFQSPLFVLNAPFYPAEFGGPFSENAVADGYWAALSGLRPGTYTLSFGGTTTRTGIYADLPPFSQNITYTITVSDVPEPVSVVAFGLLTAGGLGWAARRWRRSA